MPVKLFDKFRSVNILLILFIVIILTLFIAISVVLFVSLNTGIDDVQYYFYPVAQMESIQSISSLDDDTIYDSLVSTSVLIADHDQLILTNYFISILVGIICSVAAYALIIMILNYYMHRKISLSLKSVMSDHNFNSLDIFKERMVPINEEVHKLRDEKTVIKENVNILRSYVAHEQKNSLATLRAGIETDGMTKQEIIQKIDKMNTTLDDILTLATYDESNIDQQVDLILVVADVIEVYLKKHINIDLIFNEEDDYEITGQYLLLERTFINLIENAIKYRHTPEDQITIEFIRTDTSVVVKFRDEGIGIREERISKIFDYSYQISPLKSDGYGIGLNLVKNVVDLCGGMIWCENNVKKGICISLIFPPLQA
jgi:signal transduction histidine kinase